jgi:acetyl esterase/lipase
MSAAAATMVRLLETDHLNDQLAALAWLRKQGFVLPDRVAVAGDQRGNHCAAIDSAGGAQSSKDAPNCKR